MRENRLSGSMSGVWKRTTARLNGHRQTKGTETDKPKPKAPRHISTLQLSRRIFREARLLAVTPQWTVRKSTPSSPFSSRIENAFDDLLILNCADDPHGSPAFWTRKWIDLIDFLNQPCPAFPAFRRSPVRFDDVRDTVLSGAFMPLPAANVAVPPVVPNHLLPRVRDMRAHGREPLRGVEGLPIFFFKYPGTRPMPGKCAARAAGREKTMIAFFLYCSWH